MRLQKFTIELDADDVYERVFPQVLDELIELMEDSLLSPPIVGMFSSDADEDRKQIKKMLKSAKRVKSWYTA